MAARALEFALCPISGRRLLERERDELGKRLERWYERIETDAELGDVGAERLRELKSNATKSCAR